MPRLVSVSEVRRALYWAAGGPAAAGAGDPTEAVLGTVFHAVFAGLTGEDERCNLVRPLERADARLEAWAAELVEHAYAWHVAPALLTHSGSLQGRTAAVLGLWRAVQELCGWLSGVVWEQVQTGLSVSEARARVFVAQEQEASLELTDPDWTDSVVVYGRIDAVLRQPATGVQCLFELKTGRAAPEADLCQAALYHVIRGTKPPAHLAVVAFQPEPHEHLFEPRQLQEAEKGLKALVGRLAGVVPAAPAAAPKLPSPPAPANAKHRKLGERLVRAFEEFGIGLKVDGEPMAGPTFVRFFVHPGRGVRPKAVQSLAQAVWTRIHTDQAPQVSVQQGRLAVDVQRPDRQPVPWSDVRAHLPAPAGAGCSRFPVGVAVDGSIRWADLARPENSHFLVAGTAGSGKSEWLRALIASLLASNVPGELRLVLVDPKRTAFVSFEGAPALLRPVVYPSDEDVLVVFDGLISEMEDRYRWLAEARLQDLAGYNAGRSPEDRRARIVLLCDELADLLMSGDRRRRQEVETRLTRLAQKGRAAGIHLVLATQQPSRRIVPGALDANLMARVALKVARDIESNMVIGEASAATLLGRGDLLFKDLGEPVRLQSPYVTEGELVALLR